MYLEEMHDGTYYKIRDRNRADPETGLGLERGAPGLGGGPADLRGMLRFGPSWGSRGAERRQN